MTQNLHEEQDKSSLLLVKEQEISFLSNGWNSGKLHLKKPKQAFNLQE